MLACRFNILKLIIEQPFVQTDHLKNKIKRLVDKKAGEPISSKKSNPFKNKIVFGV